MLKRNCFFILVVLPQFLFCSNITKAYDALSIYDYFKAKQLFYKAYNSNKVNASYGLATIFFRTDNPFSNIDSAAKYIAISKTLFKDTISFNLVKINSSSIYGLSNKVAIAGYFKYANFNSTIEDLNFYLAHFYFAKDSLLKKCFAARDEREYSKLVLLKNSDSVRLFMLRFPESVLKNNLNALFDEFQFQEQIKTYDINNFQLFLKRYPNNRKKAEAETLLYYKIDSLHNEDSLYHFIAKYSTALTIENAWKNLYSISVKIYSKKNLEAFILKYPQYPYRNILEKEMNMAESILIPFKNNNQKYGYIDTLGIWVILPRYDDALDFAEGFASVCENDSCFYINKEGLKISNNYFEETESYKNGIAIVKNNNSFFLINKSGQIISKPYQEINSQSENLFVCKEANKYGAINNKAEIIIPFVYNKLGDFKNGFAYYLTTNYGLLNQANITINAQWDWISDIDTNNIAIVSKAKKYGLINTKEEIILACQFDYISLCDYGIYLIVKDNKYGFYNGLEKCFVTNVEFEYNSTYGSDYYSTGKNFKLLKNNDAALIDGNGRFSIPFGIYSNLFFAKCDMIRVQKNAKFGFIDRKLKQIIAIDYLQATDFENNVAIVEKNGTTQLINNLGKIIYSSKGVNIKRVYGKNYKIWMDDTELFGLINERGEILLQQEFSVIEFVKEFIYRCEKPNDSSIYLYNSKIKSLKKVS